jgi:hypothetical protein
VSYFVEACYPQKLRALGDLRHHSREREKAVILRLGLSQLSNSQPKGELLGQLPNLEVFKSNMKSHRVGGRQARSSGRRAPGATCEALSAIRTAPRV